VKEVTQEEEENDVTETESAHSMDVFNMFTSSRMSFLQEGRRQSLKNLKLLAGESFLNVAMETIIHKLDCQTNLKIKNRKLK